MILFLVDEKTKEIYSQFGEVIFLGASFMDGSSDLVVHLYSLDESREQYRRLPFVVAAQKLHPSGKFSDLSSNELDQRLYSDLKVIGLISSIEPSNLPNFPNGRKRSSKDTESKVSISGASVLSEEVSGEVKRMKLHLNECIVKAEIGKAQLAEALASARTLESELKVSKKETSRLNKEIKSFSKELGNKQEKLSASQNLVATLRSQINAGAKTLTSQAKEIKAKDIKIRVRPLSLSLINSEYLYIGA